MWLLHSRELRLEAFYGSQIPEYAILSHRWEDQEVSFQELRSTIATLLPGGSTHFLGDKFSKIQKTRELAWTRLRLDWVWVDTCCINKESSAELSEAINSMYRWYMNASMCYVFLNDVQWRGECFDTAFMDTMEPDVLDLQSFKKSAWFSRGWTLQELLAPAKVSFFDQNWQSIGARERLGQAISSITGIHEKFLMSINGTIPWKKRASVNDANVAEKMSWAAKRLTTREEDMAYCLLGLFDVSMPLLYGEGEKAFMRLQLEIIRKSDDESIFAWRKKQVSFDSRYLESLPDSSLRDWEREQLRVFLLRVEHMKRVDKDNYKPRPFHLHSGLLAQEPADFADSGHIKWNRKYKFVKRVPYTMTNQGLQFYVEAFPSRLRSLRRGDGFDVELNCYETQVFTMSDGFQKEMDRPIVLTLKKEGLDNDQAWRRYDCQSFQGPIWAGSDPLEEKVETAFYIRQDGL